MVKPGESLPATASKQLADRVVREYEFGQFRLTLQPHNAIVPARLLKGGREVIELRKSRRTCLLLIYLIERRQQPVPISELMTELWKDVALGDEKRSLTDVIQKLRFVLDEADPHAYIERGQGEVQFVYRPVSTYYEEGPSQTRTRIPVSEPLDRPNVDIVPAMNWIPRLNGLLRGSVEICKVIDTEPILVDRGPMVISPEEAALVASRRDELEINDQVGILGNMPQLGEEPVRLQVWTAEYAVVDVLDKLGKRPIMISGDALLVCGESEELVLHRRAAESRDYPHAIHTFGGSYSPFYDHGSLVDTARRETWEEMRLPVHTTEIPRMLLIRETEIAFFELVLLGMRVSKKDLLNARRNPEGALVRIRFSELETALTSNESWVPSGKAHTLAWLALGAPISDDASARFDGRTGQELFDRILGRTESNAQST